MLTPEELKRYDRQMRLTGFDQEKLKRAKVLIAGVGGLGSPVALYLAAAGVGHLRLVDRDVVDWGNLNRQVLHWTEDIGRPKVQSAAEKLRRLNPNIEVEPLQTRIDEDSVMGLAGDRDLIVDCMDNFPTRYVLNRAAQRLGIPFFHGAIYGLEGQLTTILPGQTPCLRCLFVQGPPPATFPVVGVTPGVIANLQAMEVIKYLTGLGELLAGRLLIFDGYSMTFREIAFKSRPECCDCSDIPRLGETAR